MAYTGTIVTEPEIALMAGENVDTTGDTEANHNLLAAMAESYLSVKLRFNVVDNYAAIDADFKKILAEWAARFAAMSLIAYNMVGFTSRIEGEDMINIHLHRMRQIEIVLDQKAVTFITP
ncbi:hypothetical protein CMI41_04850 [Candidatus Pacearchaeota archaeon]|nr:hypothetical protein [Candidatus Pacearchaeota archaeon]|tara:strand:- start:2276 stop:2635 length:360 start_codon:yes stop_codon:yes gene_type:complete